MVTAIGNPAGAVQLFDSAAPFVVTGYAREIISGGVFAFVSGAATTDVCSSGANSFISTDIQWVKDGSGLDFNGIALYTAGSNSPLAVATKGVFIVKAGGDIVGGRTITSNMNAVTTATTAGHVIGRSLSFAASGGYVIVQIG
jgi:hypothetical protein